MILDTVVPLGKRYILVGLTQCNVPILLSELNKQTQCWFVMESGEKESLLKATKASHPKINIMYIFVIETHWGSFRNFYLLLSGKGVTGTKEIQFLMSLGHTD